MGKPTRATLHSFIHRNLDRLFINVKRDFDGMIDGCRDCNDGFKPASKTDAHPAHTYGVDGVWCVGGGRDRITPYDDDNGYRGYKVSNSCGVFIVATKTEVQPCLK